MRVSVSQSREGNRESAASSHTQELGANRGPCSPAMQEGVAAQQLSNQALESRCPGFSLVVCWLCNLGKVT